MTSGVVILYIYIYIYIWCDDFSLKDTFPNLFNLAVEKDLSVASYLEHSVEGGR